MCYSFKRSNTLMSCSRSITHACRFILLLFLSILITLRAGHAQTGTKEDLEKKKEQLMNEISDMQKELDKTKKSKTANLGQLSALKKKIAAR